MPADSTYLGSLARFGVQLGLERMAALLDCLGQPQQGIPVVHVAGTNGKGSVCLLVSEILAAAGYRVGRYTSPHLVSWRERVWLGGAYISQADWEAVLAEVEQTIATQYPSDLDPPTQFEVVTAAAWLYFRQQAAEIVVLEVGLGGRLDATNVGITPVVSVITAIGMDHWQRLGDTLAQIASEKAGIIRAGVPVVTFAQAPEVMAAIAAKAKPLIVATAAQRLDTTTVVWQGQTYAFGWPGEVALLNVGLALTTSEQLRQKGWLIAEDAISRALQLARWPGRAQWVAWQGRQVLLDGAHNLPGAMALRHYLDQVYPNQPICWGLAMLSTKDVAGVCRALLKPGDTLLALPIVDHQAVPPEALCQVAIASQPQLAQTEIVRSLADLRLPPQPEPVVLAGSLYMLGQFMQTCLGWTEPEQLSQR